jgi:hypothetical protein
MDEKVPEKSVRDRLTELNTKAYYLLVALSFLFFGTGTKPPSVFLKLALSLTAVVAVFPVQDFSTSRSYLNFWRWSKVCLLITAFGFSLWWIWCSLN